MDFISGVLITVLGLASYGVDSGMAFAKRLLYHVSIYPSIHQSLPSIPLSGCRQSILLTNGLTAFLLQIRINLTCSESTRLVLYQINSGSLLLLFPRRTWSDRPQGRGNPHRCRNGKRKREFRGSRGQLLSRKVDEASDACQYYVGTHVEPAAHLSRLVGYLGLET